MKKINKILTCLLLLSSCFGVTGCGKNQEIHSAIGNSKNPTKSAYSVKNDIYFSEDDGYSWRKEMSKLDRTKDTAMKLVILVSSTKNRDEYVECKLTIPYINALDAVCYSTNVHLSPDPDSENGVVYYRFTVKTNEEQDFRFWFEARETIDATIKIEYSNPVPEHYATTRIIRFVDGE